MLIGFPSTNFFQKSTELRCAFDPFDRVFVGVEIGLSTALLLPPPPSYIDESLATGYGKSLDLAGIHISASDHLLGFRQLRGIMALVVLLVHIEPVDSAFLFHFLQLKVAKDLLWNKG